MGGTGGGAPTKVAGRGCGYGQRVGVTGCALIRWRVVGEVMGEGVGVRRARKKPPLSLVAGDGIREAGAGAGI